MNPSPMLFFEIHASTAHAMRTLGLSFLVLLTSLAPARAQRLPDDFASYVQRALDTFDVPGVGIAVVRDGQVVLAAGFGVADIDTGRPVDGRTVFGIASNTKAFTATALGLLVEEGRIGWDDPVVTHLPWFKTWDPFVTAESRSATCSFTGPGFRSGRVTCSGGRRRR